MSIITEALKKAEHERELKAKRVSELQEMAAVLVEEEKVIKSLLEKADIPDLESASSQVIVPAESKDIDFSKISRPFLSEPWKAGLIIGSLVLSLFALYFLPYWPVVGRDFLFIWYLSKNSKAVQTGSAGAVYDKAVHKSYESKSGPVSGFSNYVFRPAFVLSGISMVGKDRYAIINGRIVQRGDLINGAFVKEIAGREVVLETKTGEVTLEISS